MTIFCGGCSSHTEHDRQYRWQWQFINFCSFLKGFKKLLHAEEVVLSSELNIKIFSILSSKRLWLMRALNASAKKIISYVLHHAREQNDYNSWKAYAITCVRLGAAKIVETNINNLKSAPFRSSDPNRAFAIYKDPYF